MTKYTVPYIRKRVSVGFTQPSLTEQDKKNECDINYIINNFVKTGINPTAGRQMSYVDCTSVPKFEEAQLIVANTLSMFEALPANERDNFGTVQKYLEYVSNPDNLKDCYERGLIDKDSVDIKDVYPEMFEQTSVVPQSPIQDSSANVPEVQNPVSEPPSA